MACFTTKGRVREPVNAPSLSWNAAAGSSSERYMTGGKCRQLRKRSKHCGGCEVQNHPAVFLGPAFIGAIAVGAIERPFALRRQARPPVAQIDSQETHEKFAR